MKAEKKTPSGAQAYMDAVRERLDTIADTEMTAIIQAAQVVAHAIHAGGMVYLFGTGHSHMLAEEGHYRAGGFAAVCPMLMTGLMLHEGAVFSGALERTRGIGPAVLARYNPTPNDVLFVFSNSGVNTVPVEIALAAKDAGMTVIAVVAREYAARIATGEMGRKLADVADIVLDNKGVPGDALVEIGDQGARVGPLSTVAGAFILNAILAEAASQMAEEGLDLPIYVSANMPNAVANNAALVARYRPRNPHL